MPRQGPSDPRGAPARSAWAKASSVPDRDRLLALMAKYKKPGPRYTSYPTVPFWDGEFGEAEYVRALQDLGERPDTPLSVYVHLPFCAKRCYYCGCNAMVTHREGTVDRYLDHLEAEIEGAVSFVGERRRVTQMHWGGGTPNFLTPAQTERLVKILNTYFRLDPGGEISLEMDPRVATPEQPAHLKSLGFNRLSMGVQDFDQKVQAAIGRLQTEESTLGLFRDAREAGFESVNLDLVYGLPYQSRESFRRTVDRIIELGPDRVATFSYAHLPEARPIQRAVDASGLPTPETKFALFLDTLEAMEAGGYTWIGLDHFAKDHDEMAVAAREHRLQRNFMGYTTRAAPDLLAFGMSSIGYVAGTFAQNNVKLNQYQETLDAGHFPVVRGMRLSEDDRMRSLIIEHLMCNLEIPWDLTLPEFGRTVPEVLNGDLERLEPLKDEGFLEESDSGLGVTQMGRFFIRNIAMRLDPYLRQDRSLPVFSSTV